MRIVKINLFHHRISIAHIICIIVGIQVSRSTAKSINNGTDIVCQTPLCKELATTFISSMDQTVDPCDDFFEYACGNFRKDTQSSSGTTWDVFSSLKNRTEHRIREIIESDPVPTENIALTKSKELYKACMDTNKIENYGLKGLSRLMDEIGGWPMTISNREWKSQEKSWDEIDLIVRKTLGDGPFFAMPVMPDLKNSSSNLQWVTVTKAFNDARFVEDASLNSNLLFFANTPNNILYQEAIVNSAKLIADYKKNRVSTFQLTLDATSIMIFELRLKNIISSSVNRGYRKIPISELQRIVDSKISKKLNAKINWVSYMRKLYSDIPNVQIDDTEEVAVVSINYFEKLFRLLDRTPSRIVVNTMHWWLLKKLEPFMHSELQDIVVGRGYHDSTPRWERCISRNGMVHAIANAYVKKYFPKESKYNVLAIVCEIIAEMENDIQNSKWLDNKSKNGALTKLALMKKFVGYPDWYDNDKALASYYKELNVGPIFVENSVAILKFNYNRELKSLRQPVDESEWTGSPTVVNAYYYYLGNSLTIPVGILQIPLFNEKQPDALNYGAIGSFIGHEISHGFDVDGIQHDEHGNIRNWWLPRTKSEYGKRSACFIEEFEKFKIEINSVQYHINAIKTLNENIADTMGANALFQAFTSHLRKHPAQANVKLPGLEHLSSTKLLFLSWAHSFCARPKSTELIKSINKDTHSPPTFRVTGTVSNMDSFSDTYQCAKGAAMNPVKKCSIW